MGYSERDPRLFLDRIGFRRISFTLFLISLFSHSSLIVRSCDTRTDVWCQISAASVDASIFSEKPDRPNHAVHHIEIIPGTKLIFVWFRIVWILKVQVFEGVSRAYKIGNYRRVSGHQLYCLWWRLTDHFRYTDFRKLNVVTLPGPYPLHRVDDLLDRKWQEKYLTKIRMTRLSCWTIRPAYFRVRNTIWTVPEALYAVRFT